MNRILAIAATLLIAAACSGGKTAQCGRHGLCDQDGWYIIKDITPENTVGNVYLISEHYAATCYLVTGTKAALLIDTGIGIGSLSSLVSTLTDLPLSVVNTHGHIDHVGSNYQFSKVWIPERDKYIAENMNPLVTPDIESYVAGNVPEYDKEEVLANIADIEGYAPTKVITFKEGQTWDLGGKVITSIQLGGHTPGSMMFMDETDDMLFSGDAMNGQLWMWLDHSLDLDIYASNLARVIPQIQHLSRIYGGHELDENGVPMAHAEEMLADVRAALSGSAEPTEAPAPMNRPGTIKVYDFATWQLLTR